MTTKEFLLDQFISGYDTNGWFVALKNTLNNLTAQQAVWKADGAGNSIWGVLAHLNFYNERYLKRFKGEQIENSHLENSETFADSENVSDEAWQAEIEKFERVMNEWKSAIETAGEERFRENVSKENQAPWAEIVGLINTHNAHHGGQIVIMRKMQGSWDASKGVS